MARITLLYALLLATLLVLTDIGVFDPVARYVRDVPIADKIIHFLMFGLLALLVNVSLARSGRWSLPSVIVVGSILVAIVATGEELSNLVVPSRDWSLGDLAANYLGVFCLGVLPWWGALARQSLTDDYNTTPASADAR